MLELYQLEGCPFCQQVRAALDTLGLDYIVRTVPRERERRDRVQAVSGQTQVPVLIDPERGTGVVESEDIIEYLNEHYKRKDP
ncbi:MAG: glutaredoxin [Acidobacteria bacterium 13_1_40CM_2_68_5]|nr:MAG: glutaredoxin [Acidobacteria bacterium 13_1_40CM_2_68_5]OLE66876.1 MAG: glutaredoxin [Acidobacteria bacterium 13_1_20CM_2_68_7]